jgi:hypothetical protein
MFVVQPVLSEMILRMLPPPPRIWGTLKLSEAKRTGQALGCPSCGEPMKPTTIHEVELDHCSKHGVWFDQDELRITLYRVADPQNVPPFNEWAPAPELPRRPTTPPRVRAQPPPIPKQSGPTLHVEIREPDQPPREVALQHGVIKIGRVPSAHLRIEHDANVSRLHAVIELEDAITIIDLGSSSGTIVNGTKVTKTKLEVGDVVQLGDSVVTIVGFTR